MGLPPPGSRNGLLLAARRKGVETDMGTLWSWVLPAARRPPQNRLWLAMLLLWRIRASRPPCFCFQFVTSCSRPPSWALPT